MITGLFKVNGQALADPAGVEATLYTIDKYAERSLDGMLNREIAAKKYKYILNWPYTPDREEFQTLWNTLATLGEFASFTFPGPGSDTLMTITGYIGDMTTTMLSYWDMGAGRQADWKSLKVSVIER